MPRRRYARSVAILRICTCPSTSIHRSSPQAHYRRKRPTRCGLCGKLVCDERRLPRVASHGRQIQGRQHRAHGLHRAAWYAKEELHPETPRKAALPFGGFYHRPLSPSGCARFPPRRKDAYIPGSNVAGCPLRRSARSRPRPLTAHSDSSAQGRQQTRRYRRISPGASPKTYHRKRAVLVLVCTKRLQGFRSHDGASAALTTAYRLSNVARPIVYVEKSGIHLFAHGVGRNQNPAAHPLSTRHSMQRRQGSIRQQRHLKRRSHSLRRRHADAHARETSRAAAAPPPQSPLSKRPIPPKSASTSCSKTVLLALYAPQLPFGA